MARQVKQSPEGDSADPAPTTRVTILDLARDLGVSKTTIADALAGSGRVSAETRERIRAAADERGYVSNRAAQNLRRRSTGAVGLYIPPTVRSAPFYMDFALGGAERAAGEGYDLTLFAQHGNRRGGFTVDGAVVIDALADDQLPRRLLAAGLPMVAAGRILGWEADYAVIETPDRELALQLFTLMRDRGAARIAFVTPMLDFQVAWSTDVTEAYEQWCAGNGEPPLMRSVSASCTDAELEAAVGELVAAPGVNALVLAAEGWAAAAKPMLAARGIEVGTSFQLGSLAADPLTEARNSDITHVDLGAREFGGRAFGLLIDILTGATPRTARRVHPARLVAAS